MGPPRQDDVHGLGHSSLTGHCRRDVGAGGGDIRVGAVGQPGRPGGGTDAAGGDPAADGALPSAGRGAEGRLRRRPLGAGAGRAGGHRRLRRGHLPGDLAAQRRQRPRRPPRLALRLRAAARRR